MFRDALIAAAALVAASTASAQTAPPPGNLDDRVREQIRPLTERDRTEAMLTGDTDLVLLRQTKLFALRGGVNLSLTDNALLSPTNRSTDLTVQASAGLRVGTRIGGMVDLFADASVSGVRYVENPGLGYSALTGAVGAAARLGPVDVSATYLPSIVYSRDFGTRQITQHRFRGDASAPIAAGKFQIVPSASIERALSSPSDYRNWAYSADLTVSRALSNRVPVLAYAGVGYERREYDNYFFDFLGVDRRDDLLRAQAGIVWRPRAWADIRAGYSYARNKSTSDVNGYRAHSGTLGFSAQLRF